MLSFVAMISLLASAILCQPEGKEPKGVPGTEEPLDITGTPEPKGGDMIDWDSFSTTPEPKGAKGSDSTGESMDDTDDSPDGFESFDGTGEPGEKGAKGGDSEGEEPGEKGSKGSDSDSFNITVYNISDFLDHHHDHVHGNDSDDTVGGMGNSVAAYGVFTSFVVVALGWGVTMF